MIADFFGNDVLQDAEEFFHKPGDDEEEQQEKGNAVCMQAT